jgi:hypothetical protein
LQSLRSFEDAIWYKCDGDFMAHPELDELLDTLLPFAQQMLQKHGEFFPFGAAMTSSGEIRHVGAKMAY